MENCPGCESHLPEMVSYCPFCGASRAIASIAPKIRKTVPKEDLDAPAVMETVDPSAIESIPSEVTPETSGPETSTQREVNRQAENPDAPSLAGSDATARPVKKTRPGFWQMMLVGAAMIIVAFLFLPSKSSPDEKSCRQAVDKGLNFLSAGDLISARDQGTRASVACTGDLRQSAEALQTAISKAEATENACQRSIADIRNSLGDSRLSSARNAFSQLGGTCARSDVANRLGVDLANAQDKARDADVDARKAIAASDVAKANQEVERLEQLNRESPDLAELKRMVGHIQPPAPSAELSDRGPESPSSPPTAHTVGSSSVQLNAEPKEPPMPRPSISTPQQPPENNAAKLDSMYLSSVVAMRQGRIDDAISTVDGALAIAPNDSRFRSLRETLLKSK